MAEFLCTLHVAMAQSSSGGIVICDVLLVLFTELHIPHPTHPNCSSLVLWMTSFFHTMGPWARIKYDVMFRIVHQDPGRGTS